MFNSYVSLPGRVYHTAVASLDLCGASARIGPTSWMTMSISLSMSIDVMYELPLNILNKWKTTTIVINYIYNDI